MAFIPCNIGGGSGVTITEDTLWTNQSPSSSFTSTSITLSSPYTDYDYIKITFKRHYKDAANSSYVRRVIIPAIANMDVPLVYDTSNNIYHMSYFRNCFLRDTSAHDTFNIENTTYERTAATTVAAVSSGAYYIIPLSIEGIKVTGGEL